MQHSLRVFLAAVTLFTAIGAHGQPNPATEPPVKFSGQINAQPLPPPAEGFTWRRIEAIDVAVLVPEKWVQLQKSAPSLKTFAFSDQLVGGRTVFERGFTVSLLWHPQGVGNEERAVGAILGGMLGIIESDKQHNTIQQKNFSTQNGKTILIVRHRNAPPNLIPIIIHSMYVGDPKTGLVYQFMFESPEASWDAEWQTGQVILKNVRVAFME